jgi:hypothetical protein
MGKQDRWQCRVKIALGIKLELFSVWWPEDIDRNILLHYRDKSPTQFICPCTKKYHDE